MKLPSKLRFSDKKLQRVFEELNQSKFVSEIARIVKPSGFVVISTDCYFLAIQKALGFYVSGFPIDSPPFPPHLIKIFSKNNLELIHCDAWGDDFHWLKMTINGVANRISKLMPPRAKMAMKKYWLKSPLATYYAEAGDRLIIETRPTKRNKLAFLRLFYKAESVFYLRKSSAP